MFSTDILENGVAKACAELGIPVVAYSPFSRGFLTGRIKKQSDIPEGYALSTEEPVWPIKLTSLQ